MPDRDKPVLFLLEINTYPDNRLPGALLDGMLLTCLDRGQLPEVVTILLHPKGNVRVEESKRVTSSLGWSHLEARWRVIELWSIPLASVLPLEDAGLAPWVPLMQFEGAPEPVLRQCRELIDRKTDGAEQANLLAVTQVLAGLRYDGTLLRAVFGGKEQMIESPILQELVSERERQAQQNLILGILRSRFGPPRRSFPLRSGPPMRKSSSSGWPRSPGSANR